MNWCKNCAYFENLKGGRWYCSKKNLRFDTASHAFGCRDDFKERIDIPYHQVNNPIQIQSSTIANGVGYRDTELLTVLYQDGTIWQGRRLEDSGDHTWAKVTLPVQEED